MLRCLLSIITVLVATQFSIAQLTVTLTGATTANSGESKTYRANWKDGSNLALPPGGTYQWIATGGTVTSSTDVTATVNWNTVGTGTIRYEYTAGFDFYEHQLSVTINSAEPLSPNTTFSIVQNCGNTTVTRSSAPTSDVEWYWQTSSSGTSLTIGKDATLNWTSATPSPVNIYLRARYKAVPNAWSVSSQFAGAITVASAAPAVPASSTDAHILANGSGSATVTVASVSGANIYRWYSTSTGGTPIAETSAPTYSAVISQATDYYVSSGIGNCESSGRRNVSAYIYPLAEILVQGGSTISNLGKKVTMYVSYSYDSYQWKKNGIDISGATSSSYQTNEAGVYSVQVSKASSGGILSSNTITVTSGLSGQALNYIVSNTIQHKGFNTEEDVNNATLQENAQVIQYFDGLGRPTQTVTTQGSPDEHDIIVPTVYDAFGREVVKYLPYVSGSDGHYKSNFIDKSNANYTNIALSPQYSFYQGNTGILPSDAKPYAETRLESSPLSRVIKQGNAGSVWQPDAIDTYASSDRTVKSSYLFNGANEVLLWSYTFPSTDYPLGLINAGTIATPAYYAVNQLHKNKTKDENGNEIIEYIDKDGRTILRRVQVVSGTSAINDTNYASTYYIYDDFGNLVCVVPPEAVRQITASGSTAYFDQTDAVKDAFLKRWAFRYVFDGRKRTVQKQVPGAEAVYMVYDDRDRLVLTQDGLQRVNNQWTFTKYDELNRPIATGIKDTTVALTQAIMQMAVNNHYAKTWARYGENYIGNTVGNIHGYSNKSYPVFTTGTTTDVNRYLMITYYDNYTFKSHDSYTIKSYFGTNYNYINDALIETVNGYLYEQPSNEFTSVIGQVTGTKVKVLDGGVTGSAAGGYTWLKSVNYYDDKYRIIQTVSDNYKSGTDRVSNLYDFVGKVLKTKALHIESDVQWNDLVLTTVVGNYLRRTDPSSAWTAGAASVQSLPAGQDGWVEFVASEENTGRMVGLSAQNNGVHYNTIGYAIHPRTDKTVGVYENGSLKKEIGTYAIGDIFRIARVGTAVKYYKNGLELHPSAVTSSGPLLVDVSLNTTAGTVVGVKSSFSTSSHTILRRYVYDHAGRLLNTYYTLDSGPEVLLVSNEYNELGQLIDKGLHSVNGSTPMQSVDYRYNIRGWLTSINNSQLNSDGLTNDDASDFFGMNLGYNEELGISNTQRAFSNTGLVNSYTFNGNASDAVTDGLNGVVYGAQLTTDSQGNSNSAYTFTTNDYIDIPNSKDKHSFIQNTGKFTISAFVKINDLSARSVIVSSTASSTAKGFCFMYETYGGGYGDHQLRFMTTNGSISFSALGNVGTINDNNWHHVAVVGDGNTVRFYVDGVLDASPTAITLFSTGSATSTTLIGKTRSSSGLFLGMSGAIDEVNIFNEPLDAAEIKEMSSRTPFNTILDKGQYNGNISGMKWSVNQGMGDTKEMAYNFEYDALNRLVSANNLQSSLPSTWQEGKYHEGSLDYDLNGNIIALTRSSELGVIDNLVYNYGSGATQSNKLLSVTDKTTDAIIKLKGFKDSNTSGNDYTYDVNGNMTVDLNKGLSSPITYNYLNLPEVVTRSGNTVRYIYDATGRKLSQVVRAGFGIKQTDYSGEFVYEDDMLRFINHEEGRIVMSSEKLLYKHDGETLEGMTALNSTLSVVTVNGEKYVNATSSGTGSGILPIGNAISVAPGEKYLIRIKGYRGSYNAGIMIRRNNTTISYGSYLPALVSNEAWMEQIYVVPPNTSILEIGVGWNSATGTTGLNVNAFELIKLENVAPEYQYNLKDHLGNVRLTFTTKQDIDSSTATLEDENADEEEGKFLRYDNARIVNHFLFDHTKGSKPTQVDGGAQRLSGQANEIYGLAKSLSVMPGDVINMEVYAKYIDPNESNRTAALNTLIMQIAAGTAPGTTVVDGGNYAVSTSSFPFPADATQNTSGSSEASPKAFLSWLVYDRNYTLIPSKSGFRQMSSIAKEDGSDVIHELLSGTITISEPGYIYVFLSNEQGTNPYEVYFDDFNVEHIKSPVIASQEYYPFGLTFNNYQRESSLKNQYLYNKGAERQDELDLNVDATKYRIYDPATDRWWQVDPLADEGDLVSLTPYNYSFNNPIRYNDPDGDCPCFAIPIAVGMAILEGAVIFTAAKVVQAGVNAYGKDVLKAMGNATPYSTPGVDAAQSLGGVKSLNSSGKSKSDGPPNPNGSKGKPDHQEKVKELEKKAQGEATEGETVLTEKKIQKEGSNRRPDVQIVGETGETRKVFEAERKPNSQRNIKREEEYKKLNLEQETHKVGGAPTNIPQ
jgi:RHS repeat-associated protein